MGGGRGKGEGWGVGGLVKTEGGIGWDLANIGCTGLMG